MTATYTNFLSLTLTALGVIMAMLAIFIGFLAIWGYRQIQDTVEKKATEKATEIIAAALEAEGALSQIVQISLKQDGPLYNLVKESFGRQGDLFNVLKEEIFAGVAQWESSGYEDPADLDPNGEERE